MRLILKVHGLSFSFSSIFRDNYNASQVEEKEESVWASALSCLLYFVCDRGKIRRSRLKVLDMRVSYFILAIIFFLVYDPGKYIYDINQFFNVYD